MEPKFNGAPIPCITANPDTLEEITCETDLEANKAPHSKRRSAWLDTSKPNASEKRTSAWQDSPKSNASEKRKSAWRRHSWTSEFDVHDATEAVDRRSRYVQAESRAQPKRRGPSVQRVLMLTSERESNSGKIDPVVDMLRKESRELRRKHFGTVSQAIGMDDEGWPSFSTGVAEKMGFARPRRCARRAAPDYHPIEQFQRDCVLPHLMKTTMGTLQASGLLWKFIRIYLKRKFCCSCRRRRTPASPQLLEYGLDDRIFSQIFEENWGAEMLRKPLEGEDTYGVACPVVVDTIPWVKGLEVKEGCWLEPCKIIFMQDSGTMRPAVIVTEGDGEHEPLVTVNPATTSSDMVSEDPDEGDVRAKRWLWAKRMAMTACIMVHQLCFHLVQHLVMEGVVCCCYTQLSPGHYVFKLLEPLCGDVGFLNETWGMELIAGLRSPEGQAYTLSIADVLPLTGPALLECISRGKKLLPLASQFPFDEDGCLMHGNCGVAEDVNMPIRNAAKMMFEAYKNYTRNIVEAYWVEDDSSLSRWWESIFWGLRAPKARELTRESLAHLLATFIMITSYCHDLAHSRWVYLNHMYHVSYLRSGDATDPASYLPDEDAHVVLRAMLAGLLGDDLETPLTCYQAVFPECESDYKDLTRRLRKIQAMMRHIDKFGSMTH